MYCQKNIPEPFRSKQKKTFPVCQKMPAPASVSIEAKEKTIQKQTKKQGTLSPLTALLFLDIFANKKGDE